MRFSFMLPSVLLACAITATSTAAAARNPAVCMTGTPAQNIAVVKNFYKATQTGDTDLMAKTLAEDFISDPVAPRARTGRKAALDRLQFTVTTFGPTHVECRISLSRQQGGGAFGDHHHA